MSTDTANTNVKINKTIFISGHGDITEDEFAIHYKIEIDRLLAEQMAEQMAEQNGTKTNYAWIVGDYKGVDFLAQQYLESKGIIATVYHMFSKPRSYISTHLTKGMYKSNLERDAAMTAASDMDLAWVRTPVFQNGPTILTPAMIAILSDIEAKDKKWYKNKHISGTERNVLRRILQNNKQ